MVIPNIQDCDQLAIDNTWSLTRENACHIGNMNSEMGVLAQAQHSMLEAINIMNIKIEFIMWIFAIIAVAVVGMVIKQMWGKPN